MSADASIDWSAVEADDDDVVVRLASDPSNEWWATFMRVAERWESETRGQTWKGLSLPPDGTIRLDSVDADTRPDNLRAYLDGLIEAVNREHARDQETETRERGQAERAADAQAEKLRKLTDDLRGGA